MSILRIRQFDTGERMPPVSRLRVQWMRINGEKSGEEKVGPMSGQEINSHRKM